MAAFPPEQTAATLKLTNYPMGMACTQYDKHYNNKISKCPWCGRRLKRPALRQCQNWPPSGYGTFNGFFISSWPKTDEERWEQVLREQLAPDLPEPPPRPLPAPQALSYKSPQLRMNRHVIEPLAR